MEWGIAANRSKHASISYFVSTSGFLKSHVLLKPLLDYIYASLECGDSEYQKKNHFLELDLHH